MRQDPAVFSKDCVALLACQQYALTAQAWGEHLVFQGDGGKEDSNIDSNMMFVVKLFLQKHTKYISVLVGGYPSFYQETTEPEKDDENNVASPSKSTMAEARDEERRRRTSSSGSSPELPSKRSRVDEDEEDADNGTEANSHHDESSEKLSQELQSVRELSERISQSQSQEEFLELSSQAENKIEALESSLKELQEKSRDELIRNFPCGQCSITFTSKSNLNAHIKTIHVGSTFPCTWPGCDSSFNRKSNLDRHLDQVHHMVRQFCPECPATFYHVEQLNSHLATIHSSDKKEKLNLVMISSETFPLTLL